MNANPSNKCLRNALIGVVIFYLVIFGAWLAWGEEYSYQPAETDPPKHEWIFTEQEVKEILIQHLKSKNNQFPKIGESWVASRWQYVDSGYMALIIEEKQAEPTCKERCTFDGEINWKCVYACLTPYPKKQEPEIKWLGAPVAGTRWFPSASQCNYNAKELKEAQQKAERQKIFTPQTFKEYEIGLLPIDNEKGYGVVVWRERE